MSRATDRDILPNEHKLKPQVCPFGDIFFAKPVFNCNHASAKRGKSANESGMKQVKRLQQMDALSTDSGHDEIFQRVVSKEGTLASQKEDIFAEMNEAKTLESQVSLS